MSAAAFALWLAVSPPAAAVTGDLVGGAAGTFVPGADPGLAFTLERAEVGGTLEAAPLAQAALRLEAMRSAGAHSAFGIDGNSLLLRVKHAWGAVTPAFQVAEVPVALTVRAGLVPEPWLERLEPMLGTRALGPVPSERAALLDASDLGVSARATVDVGLVALELSVRNGEGLRELELNVEKDVVALVSSTVPFEAAGEAWDVSVALMGRHGSRGVAGIDEERVGVALGGGHRLGRIGSELLWARGDEGRAERDRVLAAAFGDAMVVERWLGVVARGQLDVTDVALADSLAASAAVGLFSDLGLAAEGAVRRMRILVALGGSWTQQNAGLAGVPAASSQVQVLLLLEAQGAACLPCYPSDGASK